MSPLHLGYKRCGDAAEALADARRLTRDSRVSLFGGEAGRAAGQPTAEHPTPSPEGVYGCHLAVESEHAVRLAGRFLEGQACSARGWQPAVSRPRTTQFTPQNHDPSSLLACLHGCESSQKKTLRNPRRHLSAF